MPLSLTAVSAGENATIYYLPEPVGDGYPLILSHLATVARQEGAIDVVVAYHSLLIFFDSHLDTSKLRKALQAALTNLEQANTPTQNQRLIRIPVCYEGDFAPDLIDLAQATNLSPEAVIRKHITPTYRVACLGFIPGFAFLSTVDKAIAMPRRASPRPRVAAGSVGIAGQQTGAYPADSPGGWQIIGRTPKSLYAPGKGLMSCFDIGDSVVFYAISSVDFANWKEND